MPHRRPSRLLVLAAALPALALPILPALPAGTALAGPPGRSAAPTGPTAPTVAAAPARELSTTDRLDDRRFVVAGPRAYEVGTEAGRYPAMGFHTRGEMGGIWSPPIKLLDGLWFGVGGAWIGPATRFTSGYGYARMALPAQQGLTVQRTDYVPDGRRAVVVGLTVTGGTTTRRIPLAVDAHSELMSVYPWGQTVPSQLEVNLPDTAAFDGRRLVFSDRGRPPVLATGHVWGAIVGAADGPDAGYLRLLRGATGAGFRGPQQPPVICPPSSDPTPAPPRCDDTAYGRGAGGRLSYELTVPAGRTVTAWFTVAGSDAGLRPAADEFAAAAADPAGGLARKLAARRALATRTELDLPGDPLLARGIDWSKQNLADLHQQARNLELRVTLAGTQFPPPVGTLDRVDFIGAGFPDFPWLFATDGEYTAFASVGLGQFESIKNHLRSLRDVSEIVNAHSGKVVHEVVTDGSVYFGANADPGNTDETVKFPSAVALVWRWTGDNAFRDEMYGFAKRNIAYVMNNLDVDRDGWPEGSGNVERPGQGTEKLDNAVYLIRGLRDLAAMAASKGDRATATRSLAAATRLQAKFEAAWWDGPEAPAYADSLLDPGNHKLMQRYWTGVTPMEAELWRDGTGWPGLASRAHGVAALQLRETRCYTGPSGLYHTGQGATTAVLDPPQPTFSCDGDRAVSSVTDEKDVFSLNTAVMAVGEGNYGRLTQQRRYTADNRRLQLPAPDEMPGAMPEIAPSPPHPPYYGQSLERFFTERASVLQAWGAYGTVWPVVHQQLGVSPDLGNGRLDVVPQVPPGQPYVAGRNVRLGGGSVDVWAAGAAGRYETRVASHVWARLRLGVTLPFGAIVSSVRLDGASVSRYVVQTTNRGVELLVDAGSGGSHRLVVTTG